MARARVKPSISGICTSKAPGRYGWPLGCGSQPLQGFLARWRRRPPVFSTPQADEAGFDGWWRCHLPPARGGRTGHDGWLLELWRRAGLFFQLRCKPKSGALAWLAFHADLAIHEFTNCLEIAKPKPVPPYLRVVEPSAWLNA